MSKRGPTYLLAAYAAAIVLVSPAAAVQPCGGQIWPMFFYSGFEGGNLEGFVLHPQDGWVAGNNESALESIDLGTGSWSLAWVENGFGWTNHILQSSVQFLEGSSEMGLVYRFANPSNYYLFILSGGDTASFMRCVGGTIDRVDSVPYTYQSGRWYVLRLELVGDQHQAYVNGVPIHSWNDATFTMGTGGVAAKDTRAWFDNVTSVMRPIMPMAQGPIPWSSFVTQSR